MSASPRPSSLSLALRALAVVALGAALVAAVQGARRERDPLAGQPTSTRPGAPRPNVLVVTLGGLRRDHVSSYGYGWETTPTIDALAADGARFATVVAPSSWSLPSYASLLTAKPAEEHGVSRPTDRLASTVISLPEIYAHAGYDTAAFVASPLLAERFGLARGFETYDDTAAARLAWNAWPAGFRSAALVERASRWLRDWARGPDRRPFFVFVDLWDVHPEFLARRAKAAKPGAPAVERERVIELYDVAVRHMDAQLERLVRTLRQLDVLGQTIVAVTSERGAELFERGGLAPGETLYDEALLVPLVLSYPGVIAPGRVIEAQGRLVDLAPTLLSLSSIPRPSNFGSGPGALHGEQSFAPWLGYFPLQTPPPELLALSQTMLATPPLDSVRRANAKALVPGGKRELRRFYDLTADPGETHDLVPENLGAGSDLVGAWIQWQTYTASRRDLERRLDRARGQR